MIDRTHALPVVRQCQLLKLALMRRSDALHLAHPFAGARMLRDLLQRDGHAIGRRHVATLMRRMGSETVYRKLHTS